MITFRRLARRSSLVALALAFGSALAAPAFFSSGASAASVLPNNRSVMLGSDLPNTNTADANGTAYAAGAGGNGAQTYYKVSFNLSAADNANLGSMAFMVCTTPFAGTTCTNPGTTTKFSAVGVALGTQTNFANTAFTVDSSTIANTGYFGGNNNCTGTTPFRDNCILVKRTAASGGATGTNVSIILGASGGWLRNPDTTGTFYVRIATFSDNAYTAANVNDEGAAAFAIVSPTIDITSKVQEQLTFSVGITPTAQGTTCAALTGGGVLNIGDTNGALSTSTPYDGHSYWRVYTNANNGTAIQYSGDTLKSTSGYTIANAGTSGTTTVANGAEMFGLGIDTLDATANGYSLSTLNRFPTSASPDIYGGAGNASINAAKIAFDTSSVSSPKNMVTQGTASPISCETGSVRYIASASTTTKPGIYRTSITYIATPTF